MDFLQKLGQNIKKIREECKIANVLNVEIETIFDVNAVDSSNINKENFIKELRKYIKLLKTNAYNFVLALQ